MKYADRTKKTANKTIKYINKTKRTADRTATTKLN